MRETLKKLTIQTNNLKHLKLNLLSVIYLHVASILNCHICGETEPLVKW